MPRKHLSTPAKTMGLRTSPPKSSGCWTGPRKERKWENLEERESKNSLHGNIQSRNCSLHTRKHSMDLIKEFKDFDDFGCFGCSPPSVCTPASLSAIGAPL